MPHVVILGGGFAGLSAARELQRRRREVPDLRITLVDRNNYMLFTPMLPEAATGSVRAEDIVQPFRPALREVDFELGDVTGINEHEQRVHVRHPVNGDTRAIDYDELIFAFGSTPSTFGISGVTSNTIPLHTLSDAERLHSAVLGALELAAGDVDVAERDRLLRFVIVGGGFTGVECAGELTAFIHSLVEYYPFDAGTIEVVIVQSEDRLLPHLPERFGKDAARSLRDRGVRVIIDKSVECVDAHGIAFAGGGRLETRTVLWDAGVEASSLAKHLGLATGKGGAIVVEGDFSVPGHPHLWALGDCASIPKTGGGTYAPLAQNAVREGPLLARNVLARLRKRPTKPFRYKELGQMVSLGNRNALAELPGERMLSGTPAWLLWRGYYLSRLPGRSHKARVAVDWMLGMALPPDLSRLPMVRHETSR